MYTNKLKFNKLPFVLLIFPLVIAITLYAVGNESTILVALKITFIIFTLPALLIFFKIKNILILLIFIFFNIYIANSFGGAILPFIPLIYNDLIGVTSLVVFSILSYQLPIKYFGMNGPLRIFLELAAEPINDTKDGFTNRPYPIGKIDYSKEQIIGFAKYLNYNLISTSIIGNEKIILVLSNSLFQYIPGIKPNLENVTYISFDYVGNMAVQISQNDYKKYKDQLTFDQLCSSLGNLFVEFLNNYKTNNKKAIMELIRSY
jgi:hypothetical protein